MTEIIVPIKIGELHVIGDDGVRRETLDVDYFNVLVKACPPYVATGSGRFRRIEPISRAKYGDINNWPIHPMNEFGKILGAIVAIVSCDDKLLLVRNGKLWGLPKGARNYRSLLAMKRLTDQAYLENGHILIHDNATFTSSDAETAEENICREALEETAIAIDPLRLVNYGVADPAYSGYTRFYYPYEGDVFQYSSLILGSADIDHENDELWWMPLSEVAHALERHNTSNKVFNHISYCYLTEYLDEWS